MFFLNKIINKKIDFVIKVVIYLIKGVKYEKEKKDVKLKKGC